MAEQDQGDLPQFARGHSSEGGSTARQASPDLASQRKRVIRGEELEELRQRYPDIVEDAEYVLGWSKRDGKETFSRLQERQPDGSLRNVGLDDLSARDFRIPQEDLPPRRPLTEAEQGGQREENRLACMARSLRIDWPEGGSLPVVRDYVQAAVIADQFQEDLLGKHSRSVYAGC